MNETELRETIASLFSSPAAATEIPDEQVPALLARLAGLQAILLSRLLVSPNGKAKSSAEPDRFLTAEEAAPMLGTTPRWLYRHSKQLPFARRLSRKALRFSEAGLRRYMASRQR
jgi:predicted DNA-binding transcriptional regulator AlpA